MINRRLLVALCLVASPALAQVPPVQQDGGMGGSSSAGGAMGGGMSRDDEAAQGVEAGHEGRPHRDSEAQDGRYTVNRSTDPRSPASGGIPDRQPTGSVPQQRP